MVVGVSPLDDSARRRIRARFLCGVLLLATVWAGALLGRTLLTKVALLFPLKATPAFGGLPAPAIFWIICAPLVVTAIVAMLLAPGVLWVLATGGAPRVMNASIKAFGAAFVLRSVAGVFALQLAPRVAPLTRFIFVESFLAIPLTIAVFVRARRGNLIYPIVSSLERRRLFYLIATPAIFTISFFPKIFWQNFSDDGVEALEIGWSLATHALPMFPSPFVMTSLNEGMVAMAYPVSWFASLIGPLEAAARLPITLYLPALIAVLFELIEWNSKRRLLRFEEWGILAAVGTWTVAMCLNASYDPYSADIASPAALETFTAVCLCATVLFIWSGEGLWILVFSAVGYLARPTEIMLLGWLAVATVLIGGRFRTSLLRRVALAFAACIVVYAIYERVILPSISGYSVRSSAMNRLEYLTFSHFRRVLLVAFSSGIFPLLSLAFWNQQDDEARQLTIVSLGFLVFFYSQAFVTMHHFVPAMILPIVVLWRILSQQQATWAAPAALIVAALSLWISLPRDLALARIAGRIGCETSFRVGDYQGDWAAHRVALRSRKVLETLFARANGAHPETELLVPPLSILYYASRCGSPLEKAQYVAQPIKALPPVGMVRVAYDSVTAVFVRDTLSWARERSSPPSTAWKSKIYEIPRTEMHRFLGVPAHNYDLDLATLRGMWRLFSSRN